MYLEVLIPTYKKTKEDIEKIYKRLNLKSDALFCNQNGENKAYDFCFNGKKIRVVCFDDIGVSRNRNHLLKECRGDICICTDDDCPLEDNYESLIMNFYENHDVDYCVFNGLLKKHNNKKVYTGKTKKVRYYCDLSSAGGPGLTYKRDSFAEVELKYNEQVGTPNYICAGEDSLFYKDLFKSKLKGYRNSNVLFNVVTDDTDSSYFEGINEQYIVTRGYITYILHPAMFYFYKIRHILRFKRSGCNLKLRELNRFMIKGKRRAKHN